SSIMSKKLATGADSILLDVKMGDGAFMKTIEEARELGTLMIRIGQELKKDVKVEITNMSKPLGKAIGNKNEILEAINTLKGKGPADFKELVISSSVQILIQAKIFDNKEDAEKAIHNSIASGKAFDKFIEWIKYQGGDVNSLLKEDFWAPKYKHEVISNKDGIMNITSAISFGIAAMKIGAGRESKRDQIDYEAGIQINKKTNENVAKGELLFTLYSSNKINEDVINSLEGAYNIIDNIIDNKIIIERIE
ncbi:MAG: pyrimidine-nucleoside phosphorylase, partial [Mycoplasmataceae bacterium]|nr:pyrimidine-nucleoside phosphorylase [Mycoplasmataceae bacterium]